jgi:predicted DNA-binding protein
MITVRLKPELEKVLEVTAKKFGITKSELVRRSIEDYLKKLEKKTSAWEVGKELFGKYSSGKGNLSTDRKKILKQKLMEKHFEKAID